MSAAAPDAKAESFSSLSGCLVEGDAEQVARAKRARRRSVMLSMFFQAAGLAALLIVPLFAKTEKISVKDVIPIPPYYGGGSTPRAAQPVARSRTSRTLAAACVYCPPRSVPPGPISEVQGIDEPGSAAGSPPGMGVPGGDRSLSDFRVETARPQPPQPMERKPETKRRLITRLDPAMLIHRVEPVYPILMKQIRRSGRVELRAVIATDGTIQSLQVVSGQPGFIPSAIAAVKQWRYRPTVLNGQPYEVETYITVIYQLQ